MRPIPDRDADARRTRPTRWARRRQEEELLEDDEGWIAAQEF